MSIKNLNKVAQSFEKKLKNRTTISDSTRLQFFRDWLSKTEYMLPEIVQFIENEDAINLEKSKELVSSYLNFLKLLENNIKDLENK